MVVPRSAGASAPGDDRPPGTGVQLLVCTRSSSTHSWTLSVMGTTSGQ